MKPTNTNTQAIERDIEKGNAAANEPTATAEQAADLAELKGMAAGETGGQLQAVEEPQGPTLQEEIAAAMSMAVAMLAPIFPSLRAIYTPEAVGAASGAIGAVCEKHGWLGGGLMGQYGEEIACLAVVGPLGFATYKAVRSDLDEWEKKKVTDVVAKGEGINLDAPVPDTAAPAASKGPAVTFGSVPA